jgi:uncharacterized membrane protein
MRGLWGKPWLLAAATVAASLTLGGCGGHRDIAQDDPPPVPDTALNFSQPIDAHGAAGAWTLSVRGTQLILRRPNQPDVVATAPGAVIQAHTASWTGAIAGGGSMKVTLYASNCREGPDMPAWPMAAEVSLARAATLNGCGGPVRAAPPKAKP